MEDLYQILGLKRDATQEEIDTAFRDAAKMSHPDHGGNADDFNNVKFAGDILRNPTKRKQYDEDGSTGAERPDSITSAAMEKIAGFFINSIDATIDTNMASFNGLDLVSGAVQFFDQQISSCAISIQGLKKRIKQYEKAIKRLKTRRKTDVIKNMLTHHIAQLRQGILVNGEQIKILQKSKEILKDYEFAPDDQPGIGSLLLPSGHSYKWFTR